MKVVYHYTSLENLEAIQASGYIEESDVDRADDAFFGKGVYLTTMDPENGRKKIAANNYGTLLANSKEQTGRVECCIKLTIPDRNLIEVDIDRDVWIHKGRVMLDDYDYKIIRWDQTGAIL